MANPLLDAPWLPLPQVPIAWHAGGAAYRIRQVLNWLEKRASGWHMTPRGRATTWVPGNVYDKAAFEARVAHWRDYLGVRRVELVWGTYTRPRPITVIVCPACGRWSSMLIVVDGEWRCGRCVCKVLAVERIWQLLALRQFMLLVGVNHHCVPLLRQRLARSFDRFIALRQFGGDPVLLEAVGLLLSRVRVGAGRRHIFRRRPHVYRDYMPSAGWERVAPLLMPALIDGLLRPDAWRAAVESWQERRHARGIEPRGGRLARAG